MTNDEETTKPRIAIAKTPEEIRRCHQVMRELRTQFTDPEKFIERVQLNNETVICLPFSKPKAKCALSLVIDFSNRSFPENSFTLTIWSPLRVTGRSVLGVSSWIG